MTAILVLAQGRTGTSTVAGILHHLGVYMGEGLLPWTPDNAKGSYEDARFRALHLQMVGGNWKNPQVPTKEDSYFDERLLWLELLDQMNQKELWGLKDPLLPFVLPEFQDWLPDDTRFITPLRPAKAVIKSLAAMADVMGMAEAEEIFHRYTQALVTCEMALPTKWPRLSILYDDIVADPKLAVAKIAAFCGLYPNQAAVDFVDEKLRHWT